MLNKNERKWIIDWRQSTDIYALSDHPIALQYIMKSKTLNLPNLSDDLLESLHTCKGLISNIDLFKQMSLPIKSVRK